MPNLENGRYKPSRMVEVGYFPTNTKDIKVVVLSILSSEWGPDEHQLLRISKVPQKRFLFKNLTQV